MTVAPRTRTVMAAEIAEGPHVLRRLLDDRPVVHDAVRRLLPRPLAGVALVARGSSDNALTFGRYALEIATGRPATFVAPSVHDLYGVSIDFAGHLAVGASQSGRTPEVVDALIRLRAAGAATVALTAEPTSPIVAAADLAVDLRTGTERAVPATKTFVAEVAVTAILAEAIGPVPWTPGDWSTVPDAVAAAVDDDGPAWRVVERLSGVSRLACVGRGFTLALAREAALKVQETALLAATAHSAASFRHGPIAAAGPEMPVLLWISPSPAGADAEALARTLRQRGVPVVTVGPGAGADLPIPGGLPDALAVLPAAVRLQQLALALALSRGLDPDTPAHLSKVTAT